MARAERSGDLKTDSDTAARQCQDDRRPIFELRQFGSQLAAGGCAIGEFHALASMNSMPRASNRWHLESRSPARGQSTSGDLLPPADRLYR